MVEVMPLYRGGKGAALLGRAALFCALLLMFSGAAAFAQARRAAPRAPSKPPARGSASQLKDELTASRSALIKATTDYKSSLEKLLPMYESELKSSTEQLEMRKRLFAQGIVARRELEDGERKVAEAHAKIDGVRKQLGEADDLIAESSVVEDESPRHVSVPGRYTSTSALIRYTGTAHWALSDAAKVGSFFVSRFGQQMPISAYGQTATHDRLGFDHRNAVDVAVHPDSAEGQALMAYLKSAGIPFIAFRHAVAGSATGAHIHIGYPSHRITGSASGR